MRFRGDPIMAMVVLVVFSTCQFSIADKRETGDGEEVAWKTVSPERVEVETNDGKGAKILGDGSVQFPLPGPLRSASKLHFPLKEETAIGEIRLEFLPDARFFDRRLGLDPKRNLILFAFDASVLAPGKPSEMLFFASTVDPVHPEDDTTFTTIDYASDTGWLIRPLKDGVPAAVIVFKFKEPVRLAGGDTLLLKVDTGGSSKLDDPARIRISFR